MCAGIVLECRIVLAVWQGIQVLSHIPTIPYSIFMQGHTNFIETSFLVLLIDGWDQP